MLVISDRVKESSVSEGLGSIVLAGPFGSFQSFSKGIGNGNTTYYCIENGTRWEVGQGVYDQGTNSLSRDLVFDSSIGGGTKISLEGPSVVFCTLPADRAIIQNEVGHTFVSGISTLELNASGVNSNSINNSGEAAFAEKVLVSGDLALLGQFLYNGNLANINHITTSGDIVSSGKFGVLRENPEYEIDVNGSGRMETIYLTSGIYFQDGTFQNTTNTGNVAGRQYANVTADYSMSSSDDVILANSTPSPINVYIPTAISAGGKEVTIKMVAGIEPVTVIPSGAELIDGNGSYTITHRYESITLLSNNSNWFII